MLVTKGAARKRLLPPVRGFPGLRDEETRQPLHRFNSRAAVDHSCIYSCIVFPPLIEFVPDTGMRMIMGMGMVRISTSRKITVKGCGLQNTAVID